MIAHYAAGASAELGAVAKYLQARGPGGQGYLVMRADLRVEINAASSNRLQ